MLASVFSCTYSLFQGTRQPPSYLPAGERIRNLQHPLAEGINDTLITAAVTGRLPAIDTALKAVAETSTGTYGIARPWCDELLTYFSLVTPSQLHQQPLITLPPQRGQGQYRNGRDCRRHSFRAPFRSGGPSPAPAARCATDRRRPAKEEAWPEARQHRQAKGQP